MKLDFQVSTRSSCYKEKCLTNRHATKKTIQNRQVEVSRFLAPPAGISLLGWLLLLSLSTQTTILANGNQGQAGTVIDFNPDNGRNDVLTRHALNWPIAESNPQLQKSNDSWRMQISSTDTSSPDALTWGWWKGGFDHLASLASDGVTTQQPGHGIEIKLSGLAVGKHSISTWHNSWDARPHEHPYRIELYLDDQSQPIMTHSVTPSHRVTHDDLAASAHVEFELLPGQSVRLRCLPEATNERVVINGLAIDRADPSRTIRLAQPANAQEHATERPTLSWLAPAILMPQANTINSNISNENSTGSGNSAYSVIYHLYLGTDHDQIQSANLDSASYQGAMSQPQFATELIDFMQDYYWRVDCQFQDGTTVAGPVRRFRVRHDAFPGAEGYGRFAIGGRGGRVIQVTNLNDTGPGSLREAVEAEGPRTIIFRIGGTIQLKSKLLIRNPYVTIAGQTAPGDGICVAGYTFGCFGTHDVIMRHVRIRVGDQSGSTMDGTGFASTDHSIFDHCSISWSIDEAVSSRGAKNITLQRCIVAEALNVANHQKYRPGTGHSFAGSISGDIGSFHHNLLVHCAGRNWSLAGGLNRAGQFAGRLDIRNNVVYNWQHRTNDGGVKALNLVNNLYLPGPATKVFHLLKPDVGTPDDPQQYYVSGNQMEGRFDHQDNWTDAVTVQPEYLNSIRLDQPFCESLVITHTASQLLNEVIRDVGVNYSGLDAVDRRVVNDVRLRTTTAKGSKTGLLGIIDSQADVAGWPELKSAQPPLDSDSDGLPDQWELSTGILNPNQPDHNRRLKENGLTALELYLAELGQKRPSQAD